MVMRLVPQDEQLEEYEIQALEEQALKADRRRRNRASEEAAEHQDGAVIEEIAEDTAAVDDSSESDGAEIASEPAVNLPMLEALLLGTHSPLTAGRLAELLDLDSTKPIR